MIEIVWDDKFKKIFGKWNKKHLSLTDSFKEKIQLFENDPFHPFLKTHSLSGILSGLWAFRINYEYSSLD